MPCSAYARGAHLGPRPSTGRAVPRYAKDRMSKTAPSERFEAAGSATGNRTRV